MTYINSIIQKQLKVIFLLIIFVFSASSAIAMPKKGLDSDSDSDSDDETAVGQMHVQLVGAGGAGSAHSAVVSTEIVQLTGNVLGELQTINSESGNVDWYRVFPMLRGIFNQGFGPYMMVRLDLTVHSTLSNGYGDDQVFNSIVGTLATAQLQGFISLTNSQLQGVTPTEYFQLLLINALGSHTMFDQFSGQLQADEQDPLHNNYALANKIRKMLKEIDDSVSRIMPVSQPGQVVLQDVIFALAPYIEKAITQDWFSEYGNEESLRDVYEFATVYLEQHVKNMVASGQGEGSSQSKLRRRAVKDAIKMFKPEARENLRDHLKRIRVIQRNNPKAVQNADVYILLGMLSIRFNECELSGGRRLQSLSNLQRVFADRMIRHIWVNAQAEDRLSIAHAFSGLLNISLLQNLSSGFVMTVSDELQFNILPAVTAANPQSTQPAASTPSIAAGPSASGTTNVIVQTAPPVLRLDIRGAEGFSGSDAMRPALLMSGGDFAGGLIPGGIPARHRGMEPGNGGYGGGGGAMVYNPPATMPAHAGMGMPMLLPSSSSSQMGGASQQPFGQQPFGHQPFGQQPKPSPSPIAGPSHQHIVQPPFSGTKSLAMEDLQEILGDLAEVSHNYRNIGGVLYIPHHIVQNCHSLQDIIVAWLQGQTIANKYSPRTWTSLIRAVAHKIGGQNPAAAEKLCMKHGVDYKNDVRGKNTLEK